MFVDDAGGVAITREQLARMVAEMVANNRPRSGQRTTDGQLALDVAVATLHDDGEIELAAAVGILHGMRVMGNYAVAVALNRLLELAAELGPAEFRERIVRSD